MQPCAWFGGPSRWTGYQRFKSLSGIHGLAKESPLRIDVLCVMAEDEGKGQLREFIEALKHCYLTVYIWQVMNPAMDVILAKYGFRPAAEICQGEKLTGWKWGD